LRIGLLPFGEASGWESIADALRGRDIDVIVAEEPATSDVIAASEAGRLQRADCDGAAFFIGEGGTARAVAQAALHVGCPLLLAGTFSSTFFDAAGALAELVAAYDRLLLGEDATDRIASWLHDNRKTERQRGIEAARTLYGQRLLLGGDALVDVVQWQRQFGVTVVRDEPGAAGDFVASDGDVEGALTIQLLRLVTCADAATFVIGGAEWEADVTYARLSRRSGRFVCLLFHGTPDRQRLVARLTAGRLHGVAGNHVAAIRAACEALDVEVIRLD